MNSRRRSSRAEQRRRQGSGADADAGLLEGVEVLAQRFWISGFESTRWLPCRGCRRSVRTMCFHETVVCCAGHPACQPQKRASSQSSSRATPDGVICGCGCRGASIVVDGAIEDVVKPRQIADDVTGEPGKRFATAQPAKGASRLRHPQRARRSAGRRQTLAQQMRCSRACFPCLRPERRQHGGKPQSCVHGARVRQGGEQDVSSRTRRSS